MTGCHHSPLQTLGHTSFRRHRRLFRNSLIWVAALYLAGASPGTFASSFDLLGLEGEYTLEGTYALGVRLEEQDDRVIDAPPREEIPIPDALKFPESNNFDDGDRNFEQYDLINNRVTMLGDLEVEITDDIGILVRGDAFYDDVYHGSNKHDAPNRINTRQEPFDSFTSEAEFFSGGRARLLDAYAYGNFFFGDSISLSVKAGQHIAAWGQSLFFSGVALAQSPADATKATVPGADVKSILLPTEQLSFRMAMGSKFTLLGQWKFEYKPTELNPTGEFFSVADIVGPGAEFAYGIRNPLFLDTLSNFDLTDPGELQGVLDLLDQALLGSAPDQGPLGGLIGGIVNDPALGPILAPLPTVNLPQLGNLLNAPRGINPERLEDIRADENDRDQWGVGLEYALNFTTTLGLYHLNYHSTNPAPRQNFGSAVLVPAQNLAGLAPIPEITTADLGLNVPVSYNIVYFEDIELTAASLSTVLFGANVGAELIYRDGVDVLVDVDSGLTGPVPTPTRAKSYQALVNAISTIGPRFFWDSVALVGEVGYIYVDDIQGQPAQAGPQQGELFDDLTFDQDAAAFAGMAIIDVRGVFPGWDLQIPVSLQGQFYNRAPVAGTYGSLLGEGDYRFGISFNFTRLQKLTLGLSYSGFWGPADFDARPLQDRSNAALTASYNFF